ncbi:hypothetical protein MCUN1_001956 [Malassezia cuniculi]|uniref:Uncharacterized protein n=1 Tax=Malassezia cuniculi TaxID=948313 RepID=A0AAF0EYN4_9BASI|nr:hypothetical protein MCUN1_001956 [Malassezia cuniculi]
MPHFVAGYGGMPYPRHNGHTGWVYPPAPIPHHVAPMPATWFAPHPMAYAPVPAMSFAEAHAVQCGYAPVPPGIPDAGQQSRADAEPRPAPPRAVKDSAVSLAGFATEAFWRTSAELLGLRRRARSERSVSPHVSPVQDPPALEPDSSPADTVSSESSECSSEPCTPQVVRNSVPSSPDSATIAASDTLGESVGSLHLTDSIDSLTLSDTDVQSAALNTLVRSIGAQRGSPVFPSLDGCGTAFVGKPPKKRATSSPSGREHSPLLGEPSPAFRRFVHQVLSQTLVSPAALLVALYYVRRQLPSILGLGAGVSAEEASAAALYVQPPSSAPFKLLTLGLMLANKYLDDNTFLNKTWHEVTGISMADLNRMEAYFLCRTQYSIVVPHEAWQLHLGRIRAYELENAQEAEDSALLVQAVDKLLTAICPSNEVVV